MTPLVATDIRASMPWLPASVTRAYSLSIDPTHAAFVVGMRVVLDTGSVRVGVITAVGSYVPSGSGDPEFYIEHPCTDFYTVSGTWVSRGVVRIYMPRLTIAAAGTTLDTSTEPLAAYAFALPSGLGLSSFPAPTHISGDGDLFSTVTRGSVVQLASSLSAPIGPRTLRVGIQSVMCGPMTTLGTTAMVLDPTSPLRWTRTSRSFGVSAGGGHVISQREWTNTAPDFLVVSDLSDGKIYRASMYDTSFSAAQFNWKHTTFVQADCTFLNEDQNPFLPSGFTASSPSHGYTMTASYGDGTGKVYIPEPCPSWPLYDYPSPDGDLLRGGFVLSEIV